MNLRRKLTGTVVLQMFGAAATLATSILIARHYGPTGQGYFSYLRSISDLLVSIGLFGFPQAFVYMINTGIVSAAWGTRFSLHYTALFGLALFVVGWVLYATGVTDANGLDLIAVLAVCTATLGALLHGLYRAIILAIRSNLAFNLISILPLLALCTIFLVWRPSDHKALILAYVAAQVVASLVALLTLRDSFSFRLQASRQDNQAWIRMAVQYGMWSFIATIAASFLNVAAFNSMRQGGLSDAIVGYFSVSLLFLSASLVPLNMIVPVLFDAWSKEKKLTTIQKPYVTLAHAGLFLSIIALVGGLLLTRVVTHFVFGDTYLASVQSTQILLVSIYALYQSRLLSAILLSTGKPQIVAYGTIVKLVTLLLIFSGWADSLNKIAWAWNLGEMVSMCLMGLAVRMQTGWSLTQVFGVSPAWMIDNFKSALVNYRKFAT